MNRKTLSALAVLLAALVGAAVWVHRSRQPVSADESPLVDVSPDQVSQLSMIVNGSTATLKRVDGQWRVVVPFDDRADDFYADELVTVLRTMRFGSVLSENASRHAQFDLTPDAATRLQAWVKGKDAPSLDLLVGKGAGGGESVYVRLAGSPQVRTAEGLASYMIRQNPEDLRDRDVVPIPAHDITSFSATGAVEFAVEPSSGAWMNAATKRLLGGDERDRIQNALAGWRASSFAVAEPVANQGLDKPYLRLEIRKDALSVAVTVGRPVPNADVPSRYVASSDRTAVMIVPDDSTNRLVESLKSPA